MLTSPNMSLTIWDQDDDDFDKGQLAANWDAVDAHDHTPGNGVLVPTAGIEPLAITAGLIANGAVGSTQLATSGVATSNIQAGAITSALLAANAVTSAAILNGTIESVDLDPNIIPLGSVMLWYRGSGQSTSPGGGWEIMDGRAWSSITNSLGLSTGNIPDMRGVFALGADINGNVAPAIGTTGGSSTLNLAHSHNVTAHVHDVPPHTHGISFDGLHVHTWDGGLGMWARTNCFAIGLTINDHNNVQQQNTFLSQYVKGSNTGTDNPSDMDESGGHDHGGVTLYSGDFSTGSTATTTDTQLGSVNNTPKNVALLFIMRCR